MLSLLINVSILSLCFLITYLTFYEFHIVTLLFMKLKLKVIL